ncbi:hypothetical protein NEPAR06_1454 [Nematocida parisii]|uniref:Uncharacterized protein n=1 Tax=Nematocida parisii (strain ERTm3) TaxID=935791 RepID=I3EIR0_NEMP3|nr:hypothetical protein NEQG_00926 [Nematocida parisii ERTm3]KAI5125880.1 hypothetical protein NEPAR08_0216 [Nematocida parisii]KAI5126145.1 hypothetical protein NEPAR03_0317 [Nematocida parisii]KAI5140390.1 hypothetical protein NEPAR04_0222 [Nematocida parisii]KAI5145444.1 hypothetical protein NEPAR07_1686 [Nematocida parisii]
MFLNIHEWPPLGVVLLVSSLGMVSGYLILRFINTYVRIKNKSTKEVIVFTVWTSIFCLILSWACVFMGQARPMISPEVKK